MAPALSIYLNTKGPGRVALDVKHTPVPSTAAVKSSVLTFSFLAAPHSPAPCRVYFEEPIVGFGLRGNSDGGGGSGSAGVSGGVSGAPRAEAVAVAKTVVRKLTLVFFLQVHWCCWTRYGTY